MKEFLLFFVTLGFVLGAEITSVKKGPKIFNVIKFPNDLCEASPRNGTCYTSDECLERGGEPDGECALGYGVCCIFSLACGGESSDNGTYLVKGSTTSFRTSQATCTYKICNINSKICRIRFDFTLFDIAGPVEGLAEDDVSQDVLDNHSGGIVGDCISDTFSIASPGNTGSPSICGFNTGQHMFVDSSDQCVTATFNFDTTNTASTRQYDIKVSQYICGDDMGGPPGCLQYHTALTGTIASFNFPTNLNAIGASVTHLSNQNYHICFRRASGRCGICFVPSITITSAVGDNTATAQTSFGLSVSINAAIAKSSQEADCKTDFLVIPGGRNFAGTAADVAARRAKDGTERFCGRVFSNRNNKDATGTVSICSSRRPFRIFVRLDGNEVENADGEMAGQDGTNNEQEDFPGGIIGFSLDFSQSIACP